MSHNEGTQENLGSNKDVRAELLDGFRAKYGEECKSEDIYLGFAKTYNNEVVEAFLDYTLSAEPIDINAAVIDLERFFVSCIVEPSAQESEFSASDEIFHVNGYYLNMTNWENSHIQCFDCQQCIEKSRDDNLSDEDRIRYLNKALNYDENSEEALYERACYCEQLGHYNDAISDLKRHILLIEDIDDILENVLQIIDLYILAKKYEEGIDFASEWIIRHPQDQFFLLGRAKLLYRANMINEAMKDLKTLEELGHGNLEKNLVKINQDIDT
jgi:tetratricopeptide (TPR) repeat protein